MALPCLSVKVVLDNKLILVPYTTSTTAEDVCITLCKQLGIGTVARHLFALREHNKHVYIIPSSTFLSKSPTYEFRIRYKVVHVLQLKKIDVKAYDYYFHQARCDVLENKIPDLIFEKFRRELVGLGVTDMYRVMLEKDIPQETVESDYKKYIPKEVLKKHSFFIKKPIHDTLGKIRKSGHDAWYVKEEYLKQLEMMAPEYPVEEYKAKMDQNGIIFDIIVRITPPNNIPAEPSIKYCFESKREKWDLICTIDDMAFISIRKDSTVEISRKTGIPFYLKFHSLPFMYSFVSVLDGYYRLTTKWTFNICKDVHTPSLQKLYSMKCHGPVGGEFSYAKLEEKRSNRPGCFILRESESKYNIYFIDVCTKDSLKPKTFKLEKLTGDEFIFNDDLTRYVSLHQLMSSYSDPDGPIYLAECLPPSEYDKSPLLLCQRSNIIGEALTDGLEGNALPGFPVCINTKDLQVYKDVNCLKWDKKRKKVRINDTLIQIEKFWRSRFPENDLSDAEKFCRNPDGDLAGPWCFTEVEHTSEVEKTYCDIPFCDDQDCMVFSRNTTIYSQYTNFPKEITNFNFGVKLWNPDSYLDAKARLVLTLLPLPIHGNELDDLGIGIEILLSNTKSSLTFGNADTPEYENTNGILKSTSYTFFNLNWDRGFITLQEVNKTKPIFLQEFKTKSNLLGVKRNQFHYYSVHGNDILWSFPFCDEDEECDVHTTTSSNFQQFWQMRETDSGHDLLFHVRAFHSAFILLVPSPVLDYPNIKIMLAKSDNYTRITCTEYEKGPTITLSEAIFPNLLNYWKWNTFSVSIFADTLHFYWTKDVGVFLIMDVKHSVVKSLRWYSPSSENGMASWSFYCKPPVWALPPQAFLPECSLTIHETHYVGSQDVTGSGLPCLPWSGKKLIPDKVHNLFKSDAVKLLDMYNYCRDPMHEEKGTFCYAISEIGEKRIDKHYCNIRKCKSAECRMAGTGNDYIGKVNTTRSNRTCQYWIADVPMDLVREVYDQRKNMNPLEDIDADLQNPRIPVSEIKGKKLNSEHDLVLKRQSNNTNFSDLDSISANMSKSVAVVQNISSSVKDYIKEIDKEPDKVMSIRVHSVDIKLLNGTLYADMTPERAENFCRNPSRSLAGAWCYTMDRDVIMDACNVPDCDKDEMCMVFLRGAAVGGRHVFILPQWKETGIHGGMRFSIKQWNPDLSEGVVFEILSHEYKTILKLIIGAEHNEKILLVRNDIILQEKTLPHTIPSGKWLSVWLQIRQGELLLGHEGIHSTMFEWISPNKTDEANPVYIDFSTLGGQIMALHFTCDECHVENTTAQHFTKIMPINIWTEKPETTFKNLTLQLRTHHDMKIRLMHLPGSGDNYDLKILGSGTRLELVKNIRTLSMLIKDSQVESPILNQKTWTTLNITFNEKQINVEYNGTKILTHNSTTPLLFYYFSIAVGSKESWVVWVANCPPLDIDGPPRHGGWSKWSPAICTVTCGGGEGYRTRTCSNPRPNIFGELCHGSPTSTGKCNEFECGDLSPETFEQIREHLKSTNFSTVINEGQSVRIYNDAEVLSKISIESPESYYEWTLNGEFLKPEPGHIDFINDDIIIHNLTSYESGVYICMLYRINKQRLVIHAISIGVVPMKNSITTRATLPITLDCKGLSLAYVYSDLRQRWTLNDTDFIDYGVTTLAGVSTELLKNTNISLTGVWKCIVEQDDLRLLWVTNIVKVLVKKAPNIYTHLMEDPVTRPIFGKMPSEGAVKFLIIFIAILIFAIVGFALYAYMKWGRLPEQYKRIPKKDKKRNRKY